MASLFSSPSMPSAPKPAPPAPDISGAQSVEAAMSARRRLAASEGRSSMLLTGGQRDAPMANRQKMLLGA